MPITTALYQSYEVIGTNQFRVVMQLTHSTHGTYNDSFTASGVTLGQMRDNISSQIADKNDTEAKSDILSSIAVGTSIPVTRPIPPAPTAQQTWILNYNRLVRAKLAAVTSAAHSTDLTALQNLVNSTYVAGYMDGL